MLACGIVSRLVSGFICDRIGGLRTLLLGSVLQGVALLLFLPFDGLVSLYVVSALFGLFQGGIVPSYAIIVREHFPPAEAGARVGTVLMATLLGMALGGWMSGKIFDLTGSYQRGVRQRHRLEPAEPGDRAVPAGAPARRTRPPGRPRRAQPGLGRYDRQLLPLSDPSTKAPDEIPQPRQEPAQSLDAVPGHDDVRRPDRPP